MHNVVGSLNYPEYVHADQTSPMHVSLLSRYSREGKHQRRNSEAAKRVLRVPKGDTHSWGYLGGTEPMRLRASLRCIPWG